jgi:8-oxo-dGTP pyrophosphatase MutT (NUDIX family)
METYIPKEVEGKIQDRELHRIVTTVIIYEEDVGGSFTYLVTRRALHKKMMPGKWTVPGGGLNIDDYIHTKPATVGAPQWYGALANTTQREIKEEVNVEIGKPELLTDLTFIRPDGVPVIVFSYFAPYISGEVKWDQDTDGDTIDAKWVTLEEAKNYDLIDGIWDEIREVEEMLKSRNNR